MPLSSYVESLYDESEKRENFGLCPECEEYSFETGDRNYEKVLCYICGVCFKYHHGEEFCEHGTPDLPDEAYMEVLS